MNQIEKALKGLTVEQLQKASTKEGRIEIRVTPEEKEVIQGNAKHLGLSVGEYLLNLHRIASKNLRF